MWPVFRNFLLVVLLACAAPSMPVFAQSSDSRGTRIDELLGTHDWITTVALGNRYLKQQSLVAVRAELARIGRHRGLGPDWKRGDAQWDAAEAVLAAPLLLGVQQDFSSLAWLPEQWNEMVRTSFTDAEIDALIRHFRTDVGRKQAKIIEHSVQFHVAAAYTMSGKLIPDFPGTAGEQRYLTVVYAEEEQATRFSIAASDNVEGQRFALSDLGAKYQKTLIIKLTGIFNARIDHLALALPLQAGAVVAQADPFIEEFRAAHGG